MNASPDIPIVFVTAATGVVGAELVRQLVRRAHIRALVRHPAHDLPPEVQVIAGDLDDLNALQAGVDGADAVVHLAAQLHLNAPSDDLADLYYRVNTEATERLVALATEAGVPRFVFTSTINVYGPSKGRPPWTEAAPPHPQTLYGRTKLDAETAVRTHPGGVVMRLAAVYGPGMKGNFQSLAGLLRRGVRVLPGDGQNRRTLVHVADVARALSLAVSGAIAPGTYNLTDGNVHPFDAVARSMQEAVGVRPGIRYVPAAPVRALLHLPAAAARFIGRSFPGPALVDKLTEDVAVSGEALITGTPYAPQQTSLRDGWMGSLDRS